jgi:hypothetical protein
MQQAGNLNFARGERYLLFRSADTAHHPPDE